MTFLLKTWRKSLTWLHLTILLLRKEKRECIFNIHLTKYVNNSLKVNMSSLLYFIPICSQRHCDIESHNIILQSTIMNMMLVFFKTKINILAKKCIKSKLNVFLSSEAFTECSCKYPHQLHTKTTCLWKHAWYKIRYHIN